MGALLLAASPFGIMYLLVGPHGKSNLPWWGDLISVSCFFLLGYGLLMIFATGTDLFWSVTDRPRQPVASASGRRATGVRLPILIPICAILAGIVAVILVLHGEQRGTMWSGPGAGSPQAQAEARAQAQAESQAAARAAAAHAAAVEQKESTVGLRIASLRFRCMEPVLCQTIPEDLWLPLFIEGMDQNLVRYLEAHGYTDRWVDNRHAITHDVLEPEGSLHFKYVSSVDNVGEEAKWQTTIGSGLTWDAGDIDRAGFQAGELDQPGPWHIIWQLKDRSGTVVKTLSFSVEVLVCHDQWYTSTCDEARKSAYANRDHSLDWNEGYPEDFYRPPPAFPYTS